jgi:hypothetical protein
LKHRGKNTTTDGAAKAYARAGIGKILAVAPTGFDLPGDLR